MIFNMPNIDLEDEEWIYILIKILKSWTEIPLNITSGYDTDNLKFYDGIIGSLIRQTEELYKDFPEHLDMNFVNSWKYQGKIYRVLHSRGVADDTNDDGYSLSLPDVEYHGMVSHWTTDYTFDALLYKLSSKAEYIILEADTKEHFAFDVNCFRERYKCSEMYTQNEEEIIFPMYKDCITEYRMTIEEFIKIKNNENN